MKRCDGVSYVPRMMWSLWGRRGNGDVVLLDSYNDTEAASSYTRGARLLACLLAIFGFCDLTFACTARLDAFMGLIEIDDRMNGTPICVNRCSSLQL